MTAGLYFTLSRLRGALFELGVDSPPAIVLPSFEDGMRLYDQMRHDFPAHTMVPVESSRFSTPAKLIDGKRFVGAQVMGLSVYWPERPTIFPSHYVPSEGISAKG